MRPKRRRAGSGRVGRAAYARGNSPPLAEEYPTGRIAPVLADAPSPHLRPLALPRASVRAVRVWSGVGSVRRPGERSPGEGSIDLTGDGRPETVRLEGEQVVVYEAGVEAWRGLPEWRVADLALGDPNDDGRAEIVLALWKPDQEGVLRSHPFIVGYRGGTYRVLWGGSALANPIHEVELRDVDGDGAEELLVLEKQGDTDPAGSTGGGWAVAAWRWHGWGFSLLWRSRISR